LISLSVLPGRWVAIADHLKNKIKKHYESKKQKKEVITAQITRRLGLNRLNLRGKLEKRTVARKVLVSKDRMEMQNCLLLFLRKFAPLDIRP